MNKQNCFKKRLLATVASTITLGVSFSSSITHAENYSNKLLLTGGVSQVEGAAGGGLTPWAVIGGYGTNNEIGGNVHYTYAKTNDFQLDSYGVTLGFYDRFELSVAQQSFDLSDLRGKVKAGLGADAIGRDEIEQTIIGAKVRVLGEAVLDADNWIPQLAVGVQYKKNHDGDFVTGGVIGAKKDHGVDFYLAATKLLLDKNLLLNGTVRMTKANQFGLLGFGGNKHDSYSPELELSAAYLVAKNVAIGAEYRTKPHNLDNTVGGAVDLKEDDAFDVFVAYTPSKNISLTAAYVKLGNIATVNAVGANYGKQESIYLSAQIGF
ncbi:MAG: DUF3034 family protein [Methylotenera sp.]|uniref:DUF3034 family protein n=1 Tax=Methylotenera sp. TaxID=2051956 RepID=UPI002487DB4C|nr:DUF3034 family protein [Methylotenera sp.]MDI1309507.1 DUF3034 family protein [Methylotenera sp.]